MSRVIEPKNLNNFFTALITEENQGRLIGGSQLRLLSEDPAELGRNVGKLLQSRYFVHDPEKVQRVARLKIILVDLERSYLVIRIDIPECHLAKSGSAHYFGKFFKGIISTVTPVSEAPLIRRFAPMSKLGTTSAPLNACTRSAGAAEVTSAI